MKILNQLTIKHLKMNKKRTIVTIIGVILSTALMLGIGLLVSTLQDNAIRSTIAQNGDYHAKFSDIDSKKLSVLEQNKAVQNYFYESFIGNSPIENSKENYRKFLWVNAVSKTYFDQLKLIEGRFPEKEGEVVITEQWNIEQGTSYKIGDTLTLELGDRMFGDVPILDNSYYDTEETFVSKTTKTYQIVGIMEDPVFVNTYAAGYAVYTYLDETKVSNINIYVKYREPNKAYTLSYTLAKNLGLEENYYVDQSYFDLIEQGVPEDEINIDEYKISDEVFYRELKTNDSLLALYGASKYNNMTNALTSIMVIVLTLISVGCIIVIYNSFAISVMERKKQFGLFSSIGATRKQLRHTVFFEAMIIGMIGIPLGILSSFVGIGIVIAIINYLLPNMFVVNLVLTAYPIFTIIPIIFMIVVILASAYLPAYKASKITPIEAIRQNDDIKIKNKKLKTPKWVRKIFGVEGEIALKNIKRNKRKYRITIVSLFISIVLFISFSTFVEYGLTTSQDVLQLPDYDISLSLYLTDQNDYRELLNKTKYYEGVEAYTTVKKGERVSNSYGEEVYNKQVRDRIGNIDVLDYVMLNIVSLDEEHYQAYLKQLGLKEERPILLNYIEFTSYQNSSRKTYHLPLLEKGKTIEKLKLCQFTMEKTESTEEEAKQAFDCDMDLDQIYTTSQIPFGLEDYIKQQAITIIVKEHVFSQLFPESNEMTVYIKAPKYQKLDQYITDYLENHNQRINYYNVPKESKLIHNVYLVIQILLYGFIILVTLIGVTSVFNTINTSIALRRKEFAMLRSMGLTPRGFNKILYFESLFFGMKSLLYGIPFSILVVFWIHYVLIDVSSFESIMIPWKSIGVAIVAVFIIVFITMMYATKKIKKENILDAIREENI